MQPKYYLCIAFVVALSMFLPVTLRLAITKVEQFPTYKHKIWVILFIAKHCGDLKDKHQLKMTDKNCTVCNRRCGESNCVKSTFCFTLCLQFPLTSRL